MDRFHELENLRRSLAMLPPLSAGLTREEAMAMILELQDAQRRLERIRSGLQQLIDES